MNGVSFSALATPGTRRLRPYEPGKPIEELNREHGIANAIKLASNENPLGPSPLALEAMRAHLAGVSRYPDDGGYVLKARLAHRHGVHAEQITLGNGSTDVLALIARAFAGPGREVVFSCYGFAFYPIVALAVGATPVAASARGFGHDLNAIRAVVNDDTCLVFIANPNNPTGTWLREKELNDFVQSLPTRVLVVVDEAYFEYAADLDYPDCSAWLARHPNLIVTRTFSKAYGLAGLRIGYAVSHPEVADLLNRVRPPFNVNILAQVAATAALDDSEHVARTRQASLDGMQQLTEACARLGVEYLPSIANFLCVDVRRPAGEVYESLLMDGVITRPLAGYELPRHLRITIGLEAENAQLIVALKKALRSER